MWADIVLLNLSHALRNTDRVQKKGTQVRVLGTHVKLNLRTQLIALERSTRLIESCVTKYVYDLHGRDLQSHDEHDHGRDLVSMPFRMCIYWSQRYQKCHGFNGCAVPLPITEHC